MKLGAMFGSLKKYKVKDTSFYHQNAFVQLETLYENETYVIFSVFEMDIRQNNNRFFPFMQSMFTNENSKMEYIRRAKELSFYTDQIPVDVNDRLITLATCSGTNEHTRLVVMGRMLRPNEDMQSLNMQIFTTTNR